MNQGATPPNFGQVNPPGPIRWERRGAPRHEPSETRLWVGWPQDGSFQVTGAGLVNISETGALLLIDMPPEKGATVWLRLEGPAPIDDVQAIVVESSQRTPEEHAVRVEFRQPFPPEFYQAARDGLPTLGGPKRPSGPAD
ncbi:PilZ domain-containing protein [Singulisphaera sp. PoT]|uniref:PilZ domain-containing protein n=1 Tax=Singulisphaera sp. PoT TaxID=3411797 RepID=UPI003BF5E56A